MRAIAIAAALFLVVVAAASGSTHRTGLTQTATRAPRAATAQVVCRTATGCVAVGGSYVLVERAGRWRAVRSPLAGVTLLSVACPAPGRCVASGFAGERRAVILTQTGSGWKPSVPSLPGTPADPSFPAFSSVSCGAVGDCVAAGAYRFPLATPLVVTEQDGTWGGAVQPQLPPDAATTRDPGYTSAGGSLSFVSCPSAGSCTAVGTYTNKDAQHSQYGWLLNETAGRWDQGTAAQLPADAQVYGDPERSGTSPFFGFTGLACPSAGNCTAVGGYWGGADVQQGLILRERGGVWSTGATAPVPGNAGTNTAGPNAFANPLAGVACAAADDCGAIGWYVDRSNHRHGLLLGERGGTWKATALVPPAKATGTPSLTSIACPARGTCIAVGSYPAHGTTHGLVVLERGGKWGRGITATLPRTALGARHTFLDSVSCASARSCTAVGTYADRSGKTRGLILGLRLG